MKDSVRINLIGKGVAYEKSTKGQVNSAGDALLGITDRVASLELLAIKAANEIEYMAYGLKNSHTLSDGKWLDSDSDIEAEFNALIALTKDIKSLAGEAA